MIRHSKLLIVLGITLSAGCSGHPAASSGGPGAAGTARGGPDLSVVTTATTDVLQHHGDSQRSGNYVVPSMTRAAAASLKRDAGFNATVAGPLYAQPLYFSNGPGGRAILLVATEQNQVYALDANTGAQIWNHSLGAPVPQASLPCGNIDPLGVTGTPVIDAPSRTVFLDAMTTPDGGTTAKHKIFALSIDDGSVRNGWPVDVSAAISSGGVTFDSMVQNQRGALTILGGTLYVPYGGHYGDCGTYYGWVVGVPLSDPAHPAAWRAQAQAGGSWAPGGVASDGASVFIATGNTSGTDTWGGGEAIIRLQAGPKFSGSSADYFAPFEWRTLDDGDIDIGGSGPVLFDTAGSHFVISLGKNGMAYLLNRDNLGGVPASAAQDGVARLQAAKGQIINAAAAYPAGGNTLVAFHGNAVSCPGGSGTGDLGALRITGGSTPAIAQAWCAKAGGMGSPAVTTIDGSSESIVWVIGAEGDNLLHGFNGETGASLFTETGIDSPPKVRRFQTPIFVSGHAYFGAEDRVVRLSLPGGA